VRAPRADADTDGRYEGGHGWSASGEVQAVSDLGGRYRRSIHCRSCKCPSCGAHVDAVDRQKHYDAHVRARHEAEVIGRHADMLDDHDRELCDLLTKVETLTKVIAAQGRLLGQLGGAE
jgi:hypothetical protein